MFLDSGPHMFQVFRGEALAVGSVPWPPRARPCGIRVCRSLVLRRWSGALAALLLILLYRRSVSLLHSNAGQRPVLLLILGWCTVPRGRCRRGGIHRFVVVAVAGVSQGFRGRHWSAARSTGGTELVGQYSLRKVVHPEGSSGPDKLRHLVPGRGVEPLRPHGQRILSAPRLPFRHPGQLAHCGTKLASEHIMLM